MNARLLRRFMAGMLLAGLLPAAQAAETPGGVSITPVRIDLAAQQHAAAITVSNAGNEEKLIQVESMQWTHPGGSDHYEPSRELVVNPPLFKLAPGASQVVRVGLARQMQADAKVEKDFRIFFQELPKGGVAQQSQLQILLRIGVPVFIKPVQEAAADLHWQLAREDGNLVLRVRNQGMQHERVSSVTLNEAPDKAPAAEIQGFAYVLPGQDRHWNVLAREGALPASLTLHAVTEGGAIHAELPLPAQ